MLELNKPVIGISMGLSMEDHKPEIFPAYRFEFLKQQYYELPEEHGAIVLPLPNTSNLIHSDYYLSLLDGLLLIGGEDVNPEFYGMEKSALTGEVFTRRDNFERELVFRAVRRQIPILGVCRGHQMINVVFGGSLYQDLSEREEETLDHRQTEKRDFSNFHQIQIEPGSRLSRIIPEPRIEVNSAHHQIIRRIPEGLKAVALAPDGVVEALEGTDEGYLLTVQWHPEVEPVTPASDAVFKDFIQAAADFKAKNRELNP
jgi:putative glutamine amidotransferase